MLCHDGHREYVGCAPFQTLLKQYELTLSAADNTQTYVDETARMILAFADPAGGKLANDIASDDVTAVRVKLKHTKRSPRTIQKYIRAIKGFTRWLATTDKIAKDPLTSIKAPTPGTGNAGCCCLKNGHTLIARHLQRLDTA